MTMVASPDVFGTCPCGRELRLLNAASDTPKCAACGRLPELCQCEPLR